MTPEELMLYNMKTKDILFATDVFLFYLPQFLEYYEHIISIVLLKN